MYPFKCFSFLPEAVNLYLGHSSFSLDVFSSHFCSAGLLVTHPLSVWLSENAWVLPSFLKDIFTGCRILLSITLKTFSGRGCMSTVSRERSGCLSMSEVFSRVLLKGSLCRQVSATWIGCVYVWFFNSALGLWPSCLSVFNQIWRNFSPYLFECSFGLIPFSFPLWFQLPLGGAASYCSTGHGGAVCFNYSLFLPLNASVRIISIGLSSSSLMLGSASNKLTNTDVVLSVTGFLFDSF